MVGEKHDSILHWHTHWEKKKHTWADKQDAPSPGYRRLLNTRRPLCASLECLRGCGWVAQVSGRPTHTHQTHTRCTQLFQCTLGFNYDHTDDANTHGYKKIIKTNKQKKTKQNLSPFALHFGVCFIFSNIFNNIHHFVSSSSCHTQTWIRAFIRHTIGKKKSLLGRG